MLAPAAIQSQPAMPADDLTSSDISFAGWDGRATRRLIAQLGGEFVVRCAWRLAGEMGARSWAVRPTKGDGVASCSHVRTFCQANAAVKAFNANPSETAQPCRDR